MNIADRSTRPGPKSPGPKSLGHVALHYNSADNGPKAARLLELMGFSRLQEIVLPDGNIFYQFLINEDRVHDGVGTVYLARLPQVNADMTAAIRQALRVGEADEHPAVAAMRRGQQDDPEVGFHFGVMVETLDDLEETVLRLQQADRDDAALQGHMKIIVNRARPGDAEIDAMMDASPVFGSATRYCYGRNGCQVFVETDLIAAGPLGENMVIEFDHAFAGRPVNMFNKTELAGS